MTTKHLFLVAALLLFGVSRVNAASDPFRGGGCKPLDEVKRLQKDTPVRIPLAFEGTSVWLPQKLNYRFNFGFYEINDEQHAVLLIRDMPIGKTSTQGCVIWMSEKPTGTWVDPAGSKAVELVPVAYDMAATRKACAAMLPTMLKKYDDQEVEVAGVVMTNKDSLMAGRRVNGINIEQAEREDGKNRVARIAKTALDGDFYCDAFSAIVQKRLAEGQMPTLYIQGVLWPKTDALPGVIAVFTSKKPNNKSWSMYYKMNDGSTFLLANGDKYETAPELMPR